MIAIRDRERADLVCRTENMSNCMESIKGRFQFYEIFCFTIQNNVIEIGKVLCGES